MTRLLMLVEGQSEEIFAKQTLAPHLAARGVFVQPVVLWTKRVAAGGGYRGGASNWGQIRRSLLPLLSDTNAWVTTLLDFYGLPDDVPGHPQAMQTASPRDRAVALQDALATEMGHPRFIPFLALHEFEAWVFCDADILAQHFGRPDLVAQVAKALAVAGEPERINHGKDTHPKARLQAMAAGYKETSDGPTLLAKMGIETIRAACPHFAAWLHRLEGLGQSY